MFNSHKKKKKMKVKKKKSFLGFWQTSGFDPVRNICFFFTVYYSVIMCNTAYHTVETTNFVCFLSIAWEKVSLKFSFFQKELLHLIGNGNTFFQISSDVVNI